MKTGRKPGLATTTLGKAIREHRGALTLREVGEALDVSHATLGRIERGAHAPSVDTAIALARWLGWSVEQVIKAARTPVQTEG